MEDSDICGIVGFITTEPDKWIEEKTRFMHAALIVDTLRGKDSAGVFGVFADQALKSPTWVKKVSTGWGLVSDPLYKNLVQKKGLNRFRAVIGHNRKATVGTVNLETAHPFQEKNITLVHNGTLDNTKDLPHGVSTCFNDSHAITKNLTELRKQELIQKLNGAFAMVWHDQNDDTINIVRNGYRPLHMAEAIGQNTIYIASEGELLFWIGKKLGLKFTKIQQPSPHNLLIFPRDSLVPEVQYIPFPTIVGKTFTTTENKWTNWNRTLTSPQKSLPIDNTGGPTERVHVGDKFILLPKVLQTALKKFNVTVQTLLEFVPVTAQEVTWTQKSQESVTHEVRGYIHNLNHVTDLMPGVIHGIPLSVWKGNDKHSWTVRPVAVRYKGEDPVLILKLWRWTGWQGLVRTMPYLEHERKKHIDLGTTITEQSQKKSKLYVPPDELPGTDADDFFSNRVKGKYGALVEKSVFERDTRNGCIFCGDNIYIQDADEIFWANNGVDPLCLECSRAAQTPKSSCTFPGPDDLYMPCLICKSYAPSSTLIEQKCANCQHTSTVLSNAIY